MQLHWTTACPWVTTVLNLYVQKYRESWFELSSWLQELIPEQMAEVRKASFKGAIGTFVLVGGKGGWGLILGIFDYLSRRHELTDETNDKIGICGTSKLAR